jgi:peptidoglycan/LPS O-acetylase OafA/YrhL
MVLENHRTNSFDALRLLAAWFVIWGHGYILSGDLVNVPKIGGIDVSVLGVAIFFTISGYLIWKSWFRATTWIDFVSARILRIFPALIVVVLLTTFLLGPFVTSLSPGEYFSSPLTYVYLLNSFVLDPQYLLPGVFESQPFTSAVNGSLWTLRAELVCYAAVPVAALLPKKFRPFLLGAAGVTLVWFGLTTNVIVLSSNLSIASFYWGLFSLGAFAASINISKVKSPLAPLAALLIWWGILSFAPQNLLPLGFVSFAFAVIFVGNLNIPIVRQAAKYGDFSYGMYLLAFPIQQTILQFFPTLNTFESIAWVTVSSGVIAGVLWHTVEGRALQQRHRLTSWVNTRIGLFKS